MSENKHWQYLPEVSVATHNSTLEEFKLPEEELARFCDELLADLSEVNPHLARTIKVIRDKEKGLSPKWVYRFCLRLLLAVERQMQANEWERMLRIKIFKIQRILDRVLLLCR